MSEYQYYEFQAIDRPLNDKQMGELQALSTRARITSTSFVNTYNFGNFRGDPDRLMEKYFDAFVYLANWGSRRFMLRVPKSLLDADAASKFCADNSFSIRTKGQHVILDFSSEDESGDGDFDGGEGWLSSLIPVRSELLAGDPRCLYLGWLCAAQCEELDDDEIEPKPPPGLGQLSASLKALVDFLRIDDDLIEAAAEASPPLRSTNANAESEAMTAWIHALPQGKKDAWLLRLAGGNDPALHHELLRQFRESLPKVVPAGQSASSSRRTVGQLLAARDQRTEVRRRRLAEERARAEAERAKREAQIRAVHLTKLAGREDTAWKQVEELIRTRQPKNYDQAVQLLIDLRDLGAKEGRLSQANARIQDVRERHGNKPSLIRRMDKAGCCS